MGADVKIDTNLQGQRLGRKGRITRQRIIEAAQAIIDDPEEDEAFSLSAVARRAELRQSSIYNYFPDLTDLFLTVLEPVMGEADKAYRSQLSEHWPDEELDERCSLFVHSFHDFWKRHSRVLHLRNALSDQHDPRVMHNRIYAARQVIMKLGRQMGAPETRTTGPEFDLASTLYTGMERVVTIATDETLKAIYPKDVKPRFEGKTIKQQARLLKLAIRDERTRVAES